jgi:hypothetical protein
MSRPSWIFCIAMVTGLAGFGAPSAFAVDPAPSIQAKTPFVRMTFVEAGVPGRPQPALGISAQGDVQFSLDGRTVSQGPTLSRDELLLLSRDLFETHRFHQIDSSAILMELDDASRSTGLSTQAPGASYTIIEVTAAGRTHEVRCPAVGLLARRFPQVADLQHLAAIQARLVNVQSVAQVGGGELADRLAREGTEQLRREAPNAPALTTREMSMVRTLPDGSQFVQFYREANPQPIIVTVARFPESATRVSVFSGAAELR